MPQSPDRTAIVRSQQLLTTASGKQRAEPHPAFRRRRGQRWLDSEHKRLVDTAAPQEQLLALQRTAERHGLTFPFVD